MRFYFNPHETGKIAGIAILFIVIIGIVILAMLPPATAASVPQKNPTVAIPTQTPPIYEPYIESPALQKYRTNSHDMGEDFTWRRDDVSGLKDMMVHATVYGYRMEPNYQWWSVSWGKYFWQVPNDGMKYIFVYVKVWMDGDSTNWDPSIYGFDATHFQLKIGDRLYSADPEYTPPIRIKELEETPNQLNTTRIQPFGCLRINDGGKETCVGEQWIRMGPENGLDGYIVYQIPKETRPEDISVIGQFRGFGTAWWTLA